MQTISWITAESAGVVVVPVVVVPVLVVVVVPEVVVVAVLLVVAVRLVQARCSTGKSASAANTLTLPKHVAL